MNLDKQTLINALSDARINEISYREALEDMVFQFAYRSINSDNQRILHAGGLSTLEYAFRTLGWPDPYVVLDNACEIVGCEQWCTCVGAYPRSRAKASEPANMIGFGYLCYDHYATWNGPKAVDPPPPDLGRVK